MDGATFIGRMIRPLGRIADFRGRSTRADFWPYMGLLLGIYLLGFALIIAGFASGGLSLVPTLYALTIVVVLLAFAAAVRRLHDVGWSGRWMAAYVVLLAAFVACFMYWRYGVLAAPRDPFAPPPMARFMPFMMILTLAANGIGLFVFVLCTREGTAGPNRYGPDPKGRSAP